MNKQFCAKSNTPRNLCRLGDVATYINGYAFAPADWDTKGLPIIRIQDLTGNPYQANYFSGEIDGRFKVHSGDILISWSASLGIFEWHGGDAVLNQHIFKVVFDKIGIEKNFFVHQLRMLLARFASEAHGATMKHLTRPIFNALPFYAPPMGEQKRISSILESISSMISIHRRQLCKIDQLAKSRFIEMFDFQSHLVPLDHYVASLRAGKSLAGDQICKNKVLKTGAVTYDYFEPAQVKYLPVDYIPDPSHRIEEGDVIISRMNTAELVGAAAYVWHAPQNTFLPDRLWKAVVKNNVNPIFLWQLLIQPQVKKSIRDIAGGTSGSMKNVSKERLLKIKVPDVDYTLQNEFAAFIERLDKSKVVEQNGGECLKKMLTTLYYRVGV